MSDGSSDSESSCGWTLISNEGSDIETLGSENGTDAGPDPIVSPPMLEEEVNRNEPTTPCAGTEERAEPCLATTTKEETVEETLPASEAGEEEGTEGGVPVCSSSDHSDIVTLDPSRGAELGPWEEQAVLAEESLANEELYLGTSSSSQYTFSTPEKTLFPVEVPAGGTSSTSSSDDENGEQPSQALRRRRARRSTATAPEVEEVQCVGEDEEQQEEEEQQKPQEAHGAPTQGHVNGTLNKCILLALVVAISMGFGHFYGKFEGTVQTKERQRIVEKVCVSERSDLRGDEPWCQEEQDLIAESKAQKDDLTLRLKESMDQKSAVESQQERLVTENQQLKSLLEREEASLSTLQEELWNLRAQIRNLEERGTGTDSILSENQRLKDHLQEEKQRMQSFLQQRRTLMAEAQALRRELDREREVTDKLKEELEQLSIRSAGEVGEADPETEELQLRLTELEKKLNFEQQRSDLWERLYVETKEDRLKGDQLARDEMPEGSMIGKVTETFDAVKNSTKEFVYHHKEQIKKAKEAVKENLRKFSDSVKSTFRRFKDSATRTLDKAREPQDLKFHEMKLPKAEAQHHEHQKELEPRDMGSDGSGWQDKPLHQSAHKSTTESLQTEHNTRTPEVKVQEPGQGKNRGVPKGCSSVFDCAYQESISLFNKALDPIRMDEFHQLMRSYLKQEVNHFYHWRELESFINNFFHNGIFIHDQMLFTDFVSGVEDYLEDMDEYQSHDDDVFEDLDEYVYSHFFGDTYAKRYGPSGPLKKPTSKSKGDSQLCHPRKNQPAHSCPSRVRKWSRLERTNRRHMAHVKIELGPLPFDPQY